MSFVLDLIVIAIFVSCVITGVKRGFVRSVMGIVIVVVAILGSSYLSRPLANYLHDAFIRDAVTDEVADSLGDLIDNVDSMDLSTLFEEKDQVFTDILERFGIDFEDLKRYFENDLQGNKESEAEVSEYIAKPLSETLSQAAAFGILFVGIALVLWCVLLLVNQIVKLPVLRGANKLLGAVFGCVTGIAFAWGISTVLCVLMPQLAVMYEETVPATVIDHTFLVKLLGNLDILKLV